MESSQFNLVRRSDFSWVEADLSKGKKWYACNQALQKVSLLIDQHLKYRIFLTPDRSGTLI
jgi:hypothetical protein